MNRIKNYLQQKPVLIETVVGYILQQDKILLGVRKRVSFGLGEKLISGIGGKLEKNESSEEALKREFSEEIKVKLVSYQSMGKITYLFPHNPKWDQVVSIFLIDSWQGDPKETEDIQPLWFKKTELPHERMWPDNLLTIPRLLAGEKIVGTFLYNKEGNIAEYKLVQLR